jgi:hypothetical protein
MTGAAALTLPENLWVTHDQGSPQTWGLNVVIVSIALAAGTSVAITQRHLQTILLVLATVAAAGFGLVSFASIGLPMLLAAGLGVAALTGSRRRIRRS